MKCSFCGTETSNAVRGPMDYSICHNCIQKSYRESCNFCNKVIGTKTGTFKNKVLVAARIGEQVIMCNECLQTAAETITQE